MDTTWSPYFQQPFFFNKQQNMWANHFQPTRPYVNPGPAGQGHCTGFHSKPTPKNCQCFQVNQDTCQVHIDLQQNSKNQVIIWGQVLDCCQQPVENCPVVLCKLCKPRHCNDCEQYQPIQQTITDCHGNYKFCIPPHCCCEQYKVMTEEQEDCNICCSCQP